MPTASQAKFSLYSTILDEQEKRRKEREKYIDDETKRANRASLGRILGTVLGAALAPVGGLALTGLMAGAGSRIGSEIGERTVKPTSKGLNESDYLFGITGEGGIREEKSEREALRKQFNQGQWASAGTDAITAMLFSGLIEGANKPNQLGGASGVGKGSLGKLQPLEEGVSRTLSMPSMKFGSVANPLEKTMGLNTPLHTVMPKSNMGLLKHNASKAWINELLRML